MNTDLPRYKTLFENELARYADTLPDNALHTPVRYILDLGGKRIRPVLVLAAGEAFGTPAEETLPAALAVEIFHNFSLVHDDIMDEAPLRRGKATVHKKWNLNAAILSGDAMLIEAYRQLARCGNDLLHQLLELFNTTAAEVCLGQQYDMDFEREGEVSEERYIEMITLKTAVLLGCSLKMGAMIAGASQEDAERLYRFGLAAGVGFQIQDDYLDAFGDPEQFGKQVGGDILADKKTLLSTAAMHLADGDMKRRLADFFSGNSHASPEEKVRQVREIYMAVGADVHTLNRARTYFEKAESLLDALKIPTDNKRNLSAFLDGLRVREF